MQVSCVQTKIHKIKSGKQTAYSQWPESFWPLQTFSADLKITYTEINQEENCYYQKVKVFPTSDI